MPLCSYSRDFIDSGFTPLDNNFITEYLPALTEDGIRVYLYGLFLCTNPLGSDNTPDGICQGLQITVQELRAALNYLKKTGLVTICSTEPLCVHFNSPKKAIAPTRVYNKDKYSDFVFDLQKLFSDRDLSETEIVSYLDFLEETKMEQGALLLICKYCIDIKGTSIRKAYVLTVAQNWFSEGCHTLGEVENRMLQAEAATAELREVLRALKSKRSADIEDRQFYLKWTSTLGFGFDSVIAAAKQIKRGGMERLDAALENYAKEGVFTAQDIDKYGKRKQEMLDCTIKVLRSLGLYYQDCTFISESYTSEWFRLGYTEYGLCKIARYCALKTIRDFAGYAETVQRFFNEGYVSDNSIDLQLDALARMDEIITKIIYASGSTRNVVQSDRDLYRTWTERWGFSQEQILSIAVEAQGKAYAISWISSRLSELRGTQAWQPQGDNAPAQTRQSGDFERAEIKAKLLEDSEYAKLQSERRKLEFEMSGYAFSGKAIPVVMQGRQQALQAAEKQRIRDLGYDPALFD